MAPLALKTSVFALEGISSLGVIEGLPVKSYQRKIPSVMLFVALDALLENIHRMKTGTCADSFLEFFVACEAVVM